MGDNATVNGVTVRTDELPGIKAQVQIVKLMDGTPHSDQIIPGSTAYGLLIDVSRIQAPVEANLKVGGNAVGGSNPVPVHITDANLEISNDAGNPVPVVVLSQSLPTGAATENTVTAIKTELGAISDPAITTDADGSASGKLRGLIVLLISLLARIPVTLGTNGGMKVSLVDRLDSANDSIKVDKAPGAANLVTNAVALTTSYATIAAVRATRRDVLLSNPDASINILWRASGSADVPVTLPPKCSIVVNTKAGIEAKSASGTPTIEIVETYD